jgi:5-methylcytosine-specific restriction endonuclease McrA
MAEKIRCSKCKEMRSLDEFSRDKYQASGHKSHCKYCCRAKTGEWQQSVKNRPKIQKIAKRCSHCKELKNIDEFAETVYTLDGRLHHCRLCQSSYDRKFVGQPKIELDGKECTRCGLWKPIEEFARASRNSDGRQDWCDVCRSLYRDENRIAVRARNARYSSEHKEEVRERHKEYYQENRDFWLDRAKENFQKFKGTPEYYAYTARKNSRRRARTLAVENTLTADERVLILELQDYKCLACGSEFDPRPRSSKSLTWDHIIPLSKGGGLTFANTQALCWGCNTRKGDKTIDYRTWNPDAIICNVKRA